MKGSRIERWWLGPVLLGILFGALLAALAVLFPGHAAGQALRSGTGWVSRFASLPDPWQVMGQALGVPSVATPDVHAEPSDARKVEALAARYRVTVGLAAAALAEGRAAFRTRYGSFPPGTTGAVRPFPPCEQHGPDFWRVVLESLCEQGHFGSGWNCMATPLETTDAEWQCPRAMACTYQTTQPGGTPETAIIQSPPGRAPGERWTGRTGFGCVVHFRAPGEVAPPPPPVPVPPPPPPVPEPECELRAESRWAERCITLGHPDLAECEVWTLANSPARSIWKLLQVVCPEEEPEPPPPVDNPPPVACPPSAFELGCMSLGGPPELCLALAQWIGACDPECDPKCFVPGAPSTGRLEVVCRGVGCPEVEP